MYHFAPYGTQAANQWRNRSKNDYREQNKSRNSINDYGAIGRRVADAVAVQHDMQAVGISDLSSEEF